MTDSKRPRRPAAGRESRDFAAPRGLDRLSESSAEELLELADELEEQARGLLRHVRSLQRIAGRMERKQPSEGEGRPRPERPRPERPKQERDERRERQPEAREKRAESREKRPESGQGRPQKRSGPAPAWTPPGKRRKS